MSAFKVLLLLCAFQEPDLRPSYVQNVTRTTAVVVARCEPAAEATLVLNRGSEEVARLTQPVAERHEFPLQNLVAGADYTYVVTTGTRMDVGTFRTFPEAPAEFVFAAYGDSRSNKKTQPALSRAMAKDRPLFVLHSGDLVEDGNKKPEWEQFFNQTESLLRHVPIFPALGNHERDAANYFDLFVLPGTERWYSFDVGSLHILILDSNRKHKDSPEQLDWIKADLAASTAPFKIAVYHHGMFCANPSPERQEDARRMYELWGEIFEEGGLRLAIQGHNHNYQRAEYNGIVYLTTAGGGAPLYPVGDPLPETKFHQVAYHYVRFRSTPGELSWEAVDVKGKTFDTFTIKIP